MEEYDLVIIGGGPAGLTAGIYAGRQGMNAVILERMTGAGSGYMVPLMENYPGFEVTSGKELLEKMRKQVEKHIPIRNMEEVKEIRENSPGDISLITSQGEYRAKSVIISTGSHHRRLNVPGEYEFLGRGVSYCATCDGPLFKEKSVVVVGGGNAAVQEAIYLNDLDCDVTIIHRRDELRAEKYLQNKLKEHEIPVIWDSVVEGINGEGVVNSVSILNRKTQEKKDLPTDGVFIAVGEEPLNKVAQSAGVELDKEGYIVTDKHQRTNLPGIYAAGDITGGIKQWVVACSEGAVAALIAFVEVMEESEIK
ncbi:thioredoxin-disulfide reductase [Methanobacterium formicicum]|jgi:thioredoxin reductase (NADPH)|uniref:Thioredoxin reductase n=1 Tax=Methanobacterium formicicum TaxID=2162 RepID=A0A090JWI9_METFO|nr:thioredoxin-disulfide reductase [Methanobacterium formicicum]MBF4475175.1 thioredoxin-disulfide reductase [Methanobacterium formicicum]MDH2660503.1 thioredoxin-disulfide reductase [Methanobacterium formicicum]CEA13896.1 thioredoxin reductase [Methanobacterium formicicum]